MEYKKRSIVQNSGSEAEPLLNFSSKSFKRSSFSMLSRHQNMLMYDRYLILRVLSLILILAYSALVVLLAYHFDIPFIYFGFVILFNILVIYLIGSYILRAVIFPYSNFFVKTYLDSMLNRKFG